MRLFRMMTVLLCCCLFTLQTFANITNDKPITFEDLPMTAQHFIQENFSHITVTRASYNTQMSNRFYEVNLSDNTCLKFDETGQWTTIECQDTTIPDSMIPEQIGNQVDQIFPGAQIRKIEKSENLYKVTLLSRDELVFDSHYNLLDEDYVF